MSNVLMRQTSKYQWEIVSESDKLIQNNISFSHVYRAEEYVKNYISSFVGWSYTVITLETDSTSDPRETKTVPNKGEK